MSRIQRRRRSCWKWKLVLFQVAFLAAASRSTVASQSSSATTATTTTTAAAADAADAKACETTESCPNLLNVNEDEGSSNLTEVVDDEDEDDDDEEESVSDNDDDEDESDDEDEDENDCRDHKENCPIWASKNECNTNPVYMTKYCPFSCHKCSDDEEEMAARKRQETLEGMDMGQAQLLTGDDGTLPQDVQWILRKARNYMNEVAIDKHGDDIREICQNFHERCALWALQGECDNNREYMWKRCAPVCLACDYLTVAGKCPIDEEAYEAWKPGDLNRMFERLTAEPYRSKYDVQVLSSPETTDGPWVITMENLVSQSEAERLIELGGLLGYSRSKDVGEKKPDGTWTKKVSDHRTSTNAWCNDECAEDPVGQGVSALLSNLTGIPQPHSEALQLLRYETGQFYKVHHDYILMQRDKQCGSRILTAYLYLNDVEKGGGTNFDKLNITVMPKRGRAVFWPSVLDEDPHSKDPRTTHQALAVEVGIKYGANAWFHIHDFETPNLTGCC